MSRAISLAALTISLLNLLLFRYVVFFGSYDGTIAPSAGAATAVFSATTSKRMGANVG